MAQRLRLLVVDDNEQDRSTIEHLLIQEGYDVTTAANGAQALAIFKEGLFQIVISDIYMPEMTGLDLLAAVKEISENTQVIMMTRFASIDDAICSLKSGACDYLIKPFDNPSSITDVVQQAAKRVTNKQKTHHLIQKLRHKTRQLVVTNLHLKKLASRDSLTGLYNHRHFQESLAVEINRVRRYHRPFSLLFIDLDDFKTFNDTNGHLNGDKLLIEISNLLLDSFRKSDVVCRYGGDEFTVIVPETTKTEAGIIVSHLYHLIADHPFPGREVLPHRKVTVSIGIATCPDDGVDGARLVHLADKRMYEFKQHRCDHAGFGDLHLPSCGI